ncbi:MAG: Oligopeptide ABC transporter, periplasmic oligopeptide-binding protein OppA [Candidatus Carbobacillus altaicus]|uniref:Oligopeptide ABC transporter, periplasmic oligopeptide-binding protein OppA n=1 Tax=Candidatus Carbonibacillus altaicus TaxID=2163959 RepID=A0A2R6Y2R9_9BACL|nr:MAG: Oligopeptide ABC transporter, periplasmic oligopeptide-binding protein OppA [Candidatus Carbobacillus altaicus]
MKKSLYILFSLLLVLTLALAGCGQKSDNTSQPQTDTNNQAQSPNDNNQEEANAPEDTAPEGYVRATNPDAVPAAAKARTDTIIIGMHEPKGVFTPWFYSTAYDNYVLSMVFEALGRVDKDGTTIPDLATWEISDDGKTYTFHIDPNAKFSDGTPVTAEDVEFSYLVYLDPNYDGRADMSVAQIVGADEYTADKEGKITKVDGIKIIDEKTIAVTVKDVNALTLEYLTIAVLPKHYYGKDFKKGDLEPIKKLNEKPLGSGPYVLKKFVPAQEVVFEANPNYWRDTSPRVKPKVQNVIFKATTDETNLQLLQTGETDFEEGISVNRDNLDQIDAMGFLDRSMLLNNGYGYIALNHQNPILQDVKVRQALMYGLDRESAVYAYSQGLANVIDVPMTKVSWGYPDEAGLINYNYDHDKAAQLLDEAGWKMGDDGYRYKDGQKLKLYFTASSPNPVNDALLPIAKENYKALGIEFTAEQMEFNAMIDKMEKGEYDMAFLAVGLGTDPDPYGLFHSNGGTNKEFFRYSDPKVDELIDKGLKELDRDKRKEIYNELFHYLNEQVPILYMYQRYNMNVISSRLEGFEGEITPFYDFTNALPGVTIRQF